MNLSEDRLWSYAETARRFLGEASLHLTARPPIYAGLYCAVSLRALELSKTTDDNGLSADIETFASQSLPETLERYAALLAEACALALETRARAHAPFSNFFVGASLVAEDASLHQGCNVESSSYGLTICAERSALVSAVSRGKRRFCAVVVAADTERLTPPCGACRQMLYDFAPDALVVLVNPSGDERFFTMNELLPEAFSAAFL
jgi:cytidine deaminase